MATSSTPIAPSWSRYLVPPHKLQFAEYVFRVDGFNPLPSGTKRKDHKDKWFSVGDGEALWVIINALVNTCGGVIDIRTQSGNPVKDLDLDDLQAVLSVHPNPLYKKCLTVHSQLVGSLLVVRKSDVFITANSHLYTRGLAETVEVFSYNELSAIVNQMKKDPKALRLSGQSLVYKAICTLTETKEVEFKQFNCTSAKTLVERLTDKRCSKTLFAMPNLPHGGHLIVGVDEDKKLGKYVFIGVELDESDKLYIIAELSKHMQTDLNGVPRVWGTLLHTDIKEGVHWFCKYIPLSIRPHTCDGPTCSTCPTKGERCLIHLYFPHFPGGVFLRKPQSFTLKEDGDIAEVEFSDWLRIHHTTPTVVSTARVNHQQQATSGAPSMTPTSSSNTPPRQKSAMRSEFCKDNVTINFSSHSSLKKMSDQSKMPDVIHPEQFDLFKMTRPINYTPPKNEIESVLSDNTLLQTIDKAADSNEAFGVATDSLFSCIKHSLCGQRPPHHLMDVLVVTRLASILLFVICSTFGSPDDQEKQRAYTVSLGRVLKMQIANYSKCFSVIVECQILSQTGSRFCSELCQRNWFLTKYSPKQLCEILVKVLTNVQTHFSDVILKDANLELSEEQLYILQGVSRNRFNFIEGPPGCGKTLLAQSICHKIGKLNSVYISKSSQVAAFVSHKGLVNVVCIVEESNLFSAIQGLSEDVEHIVIDDAQNMHYDEKILKHVLDHCQKEMKTIYVFQDSRYQNFLLPTMKPTLMDVYFKYRSDCMYDGVLCDTINVIRRNSGIVGSYITTLIPDITPTSPVRCESRVPGDDVVVKHVTNLRTKNNNGLVAHIRGILSNKSVNPQDKHYTTRDVVILMDNSNRKTLKKDVTLISSIFRTAWPECCVQKSDQFPVQGLIVDSLDNFSGLEARVVVFVLPQKRSTDAVRSISNPKYKIAIATRGIDRIDFEQEANLGVDQLGDLKFDNISVSLLKLDPLTVTQSTWTLTTKEIVTGMALNPQTGHVLLCHGWTLAPSQYVMCVNPDGQYQTRTPLTKATNLRPCGVSVHPETSDMIMLGSDGHSLDTNQYILACYRSVEPGIWSGPPTSMVIRGVWGYSAPCLAWGNGDQAVVALSDQANAWWLVTLDVYHLKEVRRLKTSCVRVTDLSVSPEGDAIYVCCSQRIAIYTLTELFSHSLPLEMPLSLCSVKGGRIVVLHQVQDDGNKSVSLSLWNRDGTHIRDLVTGLPHPSMVWYCVRVNIRKQELYVIEGGSTRTLWKYKLGGRLEL